MFSFARLRFVPARLRYFLASRSTAKPRSSRKRVRLTLERLENRLTPSTLTVTSTADDGSAGTLRAALATANTDAANGISDTINIDPSLAGATIVLTQGQLELSGVGGKITIDGSGLSTPVTISGNKASRVFQVDSGVQAEADNLTITAGSTGDNGGGIDNFGTLTINSCAVSGNTAAGEGGGGISNQGTMTVNSCNFTDDSATAADGGAIASSGSLTISNSTFSSNSTASEGGAITSWADLTVSGSTFTGNTAHGRGGAILSLAGNVTISQSTFSSNTVPGFGGGAIAIDSSNGVFSVSDSTFAGDSGFGGAILCGNAAISDCQFDNNTGQGGAGAIVSYGTVTIDSSTFVGNYSSYYASAITSAGSLTVSNSTFSDNNSPDPVITCDGEHGNPSANATIRNSTFQGNSGGAIQNAGGSVTVSDSTISDTTSGSGSIFNSAGSLTVNLCTVSGNNYGLENWGTMTISDSTIADNGGMYNTGSLTIANSTLTGNTATNGGAITNQGVLAITDSTLTGNSATNYGGAIFEEGSLSGSLTIQNSTIANNSAGVGSGICLNVYNSTPVAQMQVVNTIIADNTGSPDVAGSLTSLGHNLIGISAGSSGWISSDLTGTSSSPLNPLLGPLQNNGGPTQTMALLPGSPAIDAGDNNNGGLPLPATDQRGFTRIINGTIDIGAFEVQKTATVLTESSSAATPLLGDSVTFTATVTAATGSPSGSVDFFDSTTGTDLGSVSLANGLAALTTSALAVGSHAIVATYSGDNSFLSSQGSTTLTVLAPSSLSGIVYEDFNDNGQVDFGEQGIAGVTITLTGTDDLGQAVNQTQLTDSDGAYVFLNLRPGNYYLTETQPSGYLQGIDTVGTAGGSLSATDQFFVTLVQGINGLNYNYGEQPPAGGAVQSGQTATIGFWNNKNGQALINSFNGASTSTQLGDWLAATLPNMFGANAGSNDLAGKSNADIAALFQTDFLVKGVKLDAQVLATALSVYATNATLDNTDVAANYGFIVSGNGLGTATVNVGSNGAAFGVADNSVLTVMDLLKATDAQAVSGLLYNGNAILRKEANNVYSAINEEGDIG